jgi:hypothetical protein
MIYVKFKYMRKILTIFFMMSFFSANAAIEIDDWKSYLSQSCTTTITGGAKRMMGEKSFWVHVNVSMGSWADYMRIEKPEEDCLIENRGPSKSTKLMQCLAHQKQKWDWYARCKPIVVNACRSAGGFCN